MRRRENSPFSPVREKVAEGRMRGTVGYLVLETTEKPRPKNCTTSERTRYARGAKFGYTGQPIVVPVGHCLTFEQRERIAV